MTHDRLLNWVARVTLRFMKPRRVLSLVHRLARPLPRHPATPAVVRSLQGRGSCLSQSIALASRIPGARVAVGVKKTGPNAILRTRYGLARNKAIVAHAWIEVDSRPIDASDPIGQIIAYLDVDGSERAC